MTYHSFYNRSIKNGEVQRLPFDKYHYQEAEDLGSYKESGLSRGIEETKALLLVNKWNSLQTTYVYWL
jgi:hypothetical protein